MSDFATVPALSSYQQLSVPNNVAGKRDNNDPIHSNFDTERQRIYSMTPSDDEFITVPRRWTEDEDQRLTEAIQKFGKQWKEVTAYVGTRDYCE